MTVSDPFEVIRDAARSHALAVKDVGEGEYFFSSPLRSDSDPSVHVTRKNGKTLVADMSDPTDRRLVEETLQALGIPDVFKSADHDCGYSDRSDMERIAALAARNRKASSHSPGNRENQGAGPSRPTGEVHTVCAGEREPGLLRRVPSAMRPLACGTGARSHTGHVPRVWRGGNAPYGLLSVERGHAHTLQ